MVEVPLNEYLGGRRIRETPRWRYPDHAKVLEELMKGGRLPVAAPNVLSGVFDAHPRLQMIIGHMGETLPFLLWRVNQALSRVENTQTRSFREIFEAHFHVTTSGNFSNPALLCTVQEMGVDRIMFSVDYPFVENRPGVDWAEQLSFSREDREKILNGNVRKLLRL